MKHLRWFLALNVVMVSIGLISSVVAQPKPEQAKPDQPKPVVQEEQITYLSGKLQIKARVFWPVGDGPFPTLIFNHGGITGLSRGTLDRCREFAQVGFAVFASSYRGEDGSDGVVEVAKGEVDDALAGLAWMQQQPRVDATRVAVGGTSHGALVSLLAASRTDQFRALVFMYGVSDIYTWYAYLKRTNQLANDQLTRDTYGNGPEDRPISFQIRYGLGVVNRLPTWMPTLIVQGGKDTIVPPEQATALQKTLEQSGRRVMLKLYPDSPHGFFISRETETRASKTRGQASVDAFNAVVTFLRTELK